MRAGGDRRIPWGRLRRLAADLPPAAMDVLLSAFAGVATVYRIGWGVREVGDQAPDLIAYGIGVAMSILLLARRRCPTMTLSGVVLLWLAYHVLDYPGGEPAVPVWIALYSVAVAARRRAGLAVAGGLLVCDALARTADTGAWLFDAVLDGSTVLFLAALLLGDAVRSRRAWRAEHEARLALLAAEKERAAAQLLADERLRIARELHDVSASTLAVVAVQANVAAELIGDEPERAGQAVELVRTACREAMGELRAAVGLLRTPADGPPHVPEPAYGLERLEHLAAVHGAAGPRVEITYVGDRLTLPRLLETTAYRIVQESMTNALRHARATRVDITVEFRSAGLALEIRDDGRGVARPPGDVPSGVSGVVGLSGVSGGDAGGSTGGNGLRGMAERAASVGGRLDAGPVEGGAGFRVRAWLPVAVGT
ncbi:sensor histidine kinase [Nonomuraea angiospora]|uniref:histidine kinase n=1 Tax=Nonomuraea angiospora TaxID=46172 RepID=A0ABR9LW14_9ACTN|nr:histidine kinase [Nonomuraea angiospora]MBE1584515.1 signal transduction histidine kinase [Nonomuraea angiospora]